ncbi:MAG: dihydrofolate reductase [Candidatus Aenigmarchaeota archaeon]|nr:dihydrofolate reductase [Candidatus Aenigmarchaeota archaeon]
MKKITLYIAISLDGFIARKDGRIDWLSPFENSEEDYGYKEFYKNVDTVIMGNKTYKQTLSFSEFPFKDKKCYVFTRDKKKTKDENAIFVNKKTKNFIKKLDKEDKNMWLVGGASIVKEFLKLDLIDEFIISVIPILLGDGIRLFNGKLNEKILRLIDIKSFDSGLAQIYYKRIR